jgi:Rrf2 family transcriptional regulator, cysteine metabolism repressor
MSKKSEYACMALVDLVRNYQKEVMKIAELLERNDIPKKFLEQILLLLKSTGYVKSIRGTKGGYKLAKSPENITLAEVIRLFEGPLAPVESVSVYFYEYSPIEKNEKLVSVFKDIDITLRLYTMTISLHFVKG